MPTNSVWATGLLAVAHLASSLPVFHDQQPSQYRLVEFPQHRPIKGIQLGPRPYYLISAMEEGPLKSRLESCAESGTMRSSAFSIAHRGGGTMQIPEHTLESNLAGARMGAGVLECDVSFTLDRQLVCRHSQCDLHTTTNIVTVPELNAKCTVPFKPAADGMPAEAMCCTSDITAQEFKSLCGKMDGFDPNATTPEQYLKGTPDWRTDLYSTCGTLMTHKEHIQLVKDLGLQFTPELKTPQVGMPFQGNYTQQVYAQQLIDEYKEAGVSPFRVWPQSFLYDDILYWLKAEKEFGQQAMLLDESGDVPGTFPEAVARLTDYAADGVRIVAPPLSYLVSAHEGQMVPSAYAIRAKELGLKMVAWSLERSGPLSRGGGGYYYDSVKDIIKGDGDVMKMLHVLAHDVGVMGVFSDWSSTVTFYANCFKLFPK